MLLDHKFISLFKISKYESDNIENVRVRTSNILFSVRIMKILAIQSKFPPPPRTQEINQRLATIQVICIQEKWLNLSRNSKLVTSSSLKLHGNLENQELIIMVQTSSQQQQEEAEWVWRYFKVPFSEKCNYLTYLAVPWQIPLAMRIFI